MHPKVHAKKLDKIIGFKISKIEEKLLRKYRAYYKTLELAHNSGKKGRCTFPYNLSNVCLSTYTRITLTM